MKKQNFLISILIINFNNAKFIKRSINSCLRQTYKNFEILIYDDKSTDTSKLELNKYKRNKRIKIFFNKYKKKNVPAFDAMKGYLYLYKKSKGSIICLLDSDDYFHKKKINEIRKIFEGKKNIQFIQNLPSIINNRKIKKQLNKNNPMSFWPYLAPESCISFKKNFMRKFLKVNKRLENKYSNIWFGFRMGVYSYYVAKNFYSLDKNLTFYESIGESKKYSFFGRNWMQRRRESFQYLRDISLKRQILNKNLDYLFTNFITNIYKLR